MRLAISRCIRGSSINNILTFHIGNNATTVLYYRRRISLFHRSNLHQEKTHHRDRERAEAFYYFSSARETRDWTDTLESQKEE